jgi:tetratricopeptide (TPR) repeat protein
MNGISGKRIAGNFGGSRFAAFLVTVAVAGAMLPGRAAMAQDATKVASIHGHVQNAAGQPIHGATVRLTTDHFTDATKAKWNYTFPVDDNGDYKGTGIAPETYLVVVYAQDVVVDYFKDEAFKAGEDKLVDFDMTRKDFIDKMTPEQKTALEEYKKKIAEAAKGNAKIQNLNALLKQARDDNKAGNYDAAAKAMTDATAQAPTEAILWITLGDAQLGQADKAQKAAKAAGKPATDPDVVKAFSDAAESYKKAIDLNAASKKPSPEAAADAYNQMGQAYGRSGNVKDSADAYDNAAKAEPAKAGMYLLNEAVTLYNAGKTDDAAVAADKAITADPNKADAYYIKGQSLIQKVTVDSKTNKITAPPGCVDAYQHYLALAPDGSHAAEVKEILTGIGEKIESNYKAPKKKS